MRTYELEMETYEVDQHVINDNRHDVWRDRLNSDWNDWIDDSL